MSRGPNLTDPQKRVSECDRVTDESERLPGEELSLVNGDHSPPAFTRRQFSLSELFWQFLLGGPPRPENNHPRHVCQLFEKLTTISNCTYYSHLRLLEQLHLKKSQPWLHISACQQERLAAPVGFTLLTTSRLCFCFGGAEHRGKAEAALLCKPRRNSFSGSGQIWMDQGGYRVMSCIFSINTEMWKWQFLWTDE